MEYPKLRPVPISTKGKSLFVKIWIWFFCSRKWEVVEDWEFSTFVLGEYRTIFIPSGFVFDGASVPKFMWSILSPTGLLFIPGLVHDYAYRYRCIITINDKKRTLHRIYDDDHKMWDTLFRDISVRINGCRAISYCAWIALWLFGGFAWRGNRKLERKRVAAQWASLSKFDIK